MSDEVDPDLGQSRMMENLYWWGIPTLFRCPIARDPADCDIALVGVPHSTGNGTTERDQHLGPRAVRHVSAVARRVHLGMGLDPWQSCRIADLNDVPLPEANDNEASIARITEFYRAIDAAAARPVSIGGDHSITGGILQALGGGNLSKGEKVALLHIDAHTDVFTKVPHFLGARKSAAHWGAYLADQGHIDPGASVQIGIRGNPRTLDWLQPSYEYGYSVITMKEYRGMGPEAAIAQIRETLAGRPVYITFDLDSLDPTVAPGVANLEPGEQGFQVDEALALLHAVRGMNIIGGDVVCLMPTRDHSNMITARVAAAVMFEMIALIGERVGPSPRRTGDPVFPKTPELG
ncbi:MAG: arginase family protein [Pseudomonadota bacterium]